MKKFTKRLISCVAVAAIAASMAAPALADNEIAAEWNNTSKALTVKSTYTADQKTLLIVKKGTDLTNIQDPDAVIMQIDQQAGTYYTSAGVEVPHKELADGDYTVYMGGDGNVYHVDFHVGEGSTRLLGNVNDDTRINTTDASLIVQHVLGKPRLTGEKLQAADINDDGRANTTDSSLVVQYVLGSRTYTDGTKTVSQKTRTVAEAN